MRTLVVSLAVVLCLCFTHPAKAEQRMFIIGTDGSGYGIDQFMASGARCGAAAANAYCQGHQFDDATSYRQVDRGDITGAIPAGGGCSGDNCDDLVAITCAR